MDGPACAFSATLGLGERTDASRIRREHLPDLFDGVCRHSGVNHCVAVRADRPKVTDWIHFVLLPYRGERNKMMYVDE